MTLALDRPRRWSSTTTFVVVAVVALVNLSAFWRLPHLITTSGGSAFIVVYVVAALVIGLPLVAGQLLLCRGANLDIPGVVAAATAGSRAGRLWRALAVVMLAVMLLLLAIYTVVASWSVAFAVRGLAGVLPSESMAVAADYFYRFVHDSARGWGWMLLFIAVLAVVAGTGLRRGVEPFMRTLAGILVAGLVVLIVVALTRGVAGATLASLFGFRPQALTWSAVGAALGQVIFGLGLGTGVLLALGAYLPPRTAVVKVASAVVGGQIILSLAAAVAVALLVQPSALVALDSLNQLFVVLPAHAGDNGMTSIVLLLGAVAAFTTAMALFEPLVRMLERRLGWSAHRASLIAAVAVFVIGLVALLSFGPLASWPGLDAQFFQRLVWLTGGVMLPIGAIWLAVVSSGAVEQRMADADMDSDRHRYAGLAVWLELLRVPALLALIIVGLKASGILAWAGALWGV